MAGIVESLFRSHEAVSEFLRDHGEVSFQVTLESTTPKVVLLAAASFLEDRVQEILADYYEEVTRSSEVAISFVRNKAIKRQFHTYFDWDGRSASPFFGLFGATFKDRAVSTLREDDVLAAAVRDFCELGALRNQLVHQNYGSFTLEKTAQELFVQYENALVFVERLPSMLRNEWD